MSTSDPAELIGKFSPKVNGAQQEAAAAIDLAAPPLTISGRQSWLPDSTASVAAWFEFIQPDFVQSNVSIIAGAKKLIEARKALGREGGFTLLVEGLGMGLDKAERLMVIARHPVLSDSAHARSLPLSWMTLFTLTKIPPEAVAQLIADGSIHPKLERKEAERLVEQARGRNSRADDRSDHGGNHHGDDHGSDHNGDHGGDRTEDCSGDGGDGGDHGEHHDADDDGDEDHHHNVGEDDDRDEPAETDNKLAQNAVDQDDPGEIARKLARAEELEHQARLWEFQRSGFESEVEELKARLDEANIPHQRRLFRQALRSLQKAEVSGIDEKEKRSLRASATTDFVEFVRSATRDGLGLNRFDVVCRPERH